MSRVCAFPQLYFYSNAIINTFAKYLLGEIQAGKVFLLDAPISCIFPSMAVDGSLHGVNPVHVSAVCLVAVWLCLQAKNLGTCRNGL